MEKEITHLKAHFEMHNSHTKALNLLLAANMELLQVKEIFALE